MRASSAPIVAMSVASSPGGSPVRKSKTTKERGPSGASTSTLSAPLLATQGEATAAPARFRCWSSAVSCCGAVQRRRRVESHGWLQRSTTPPGGLALLAPSDLSLTYLIRQTYLLLVSSDLTELRALSDRLLVFFRGRIAATLPPDASDERLGALMTGAAA